MFSNTTLKSFEPNWIKRQFLKFYFFRLGLKYAILYKIDLIRFKDKLELEGI